MENKKPTVTIGIPAHNEEQNISNLIHSLILQKIENGYLEKIVVVSDGSTDETVKRVKEINNEKIELIELPERSGKYNAQNYLASEIESDILVILDADILPVDDSFVDNLILPIIQNEKTGLTAANSIPAEPRTFFEKILSNSHQLKKEIALKINDRDNIYLCSGLARAFSKSFYKKMRWISGFPEDAFSFIKCSEYGFKFVYAQNAKLIFRLPSSVKDHFRQSRRFHDGVKKIEKIGNYRRYYRIPQFLSLTVVIKFIVRKPLPTLSYLLIVFYIRYLLPNSNFEDNWTSASTTKEIVLDDKTLRLNKKYSVSIGIPAYNEEANIAKLLKSILNQEESNFYIQEILIFSDGSTDKTVQRSNFGDVRIKIFEDSKREGKTVRQNQMIKEMTGDILVVFDADIIVLDNKYLEKIIALFYTNKNVGIVGGRAIPLPPENLFERIINYSVSLKDDIYQQRNNGNNLYFCHGRNRAFSSIFLQNFSWPKIASEDAFSYLSCIGRGFQFISPKEAKVFYRLPHNMKDYLKQSTRFLKSKKLIIRWFDKKLVDNEYRINYLYILKSAIKYFFKNPFYFIVYTVILATSKIKTFFQGESDHRWDISESSKKLD